MSFLKKKKAYIIVGPMERKIGLMASSYKSLCRKSSEKFFGENRKELSFTLDDGTEIDEEYFEVLESKACLHVKTSTMNKFYPILNHLEQFLTKYFEKNCNLQEKLNEVIENKDLLQLLKLIKIEDYSSEDYVQHSSKMKDPDWFKGLDTRFKTKELVLRNSAETRMRGYLQTLKKSLNDPKNERYAQSIEYLRNKLKFNKYNSDYFDRGASEEKRLCNYLGVFNCCGDFKANVCSFSHQINPYTSREARIIFSTWNLDHIIEKSRVIIPLLKQCLDENIKAINMDYFYELLFVHMNEIDNKNVGNLKLVHIVCHNKSPHLVKCDKKRLFCEVE